jgi:hypothetical protein
MHVRPNQSCIRNQHGGFKPSRKVNPINPGHKRLASARRYHHASRTEMDSSHHGMSKATSDQFAPINAGDAAAD